MKNYVASLFTFFEKVFAICKCFTTGCLNVRFWDLLYFICLKFNPQYWYLLLRREKCVDSVVIFNKWREETFAVSYNIAKAALQYLKLVPPRKLTSSIAKKIFISQFFEEIKLYLYLLLFKKKKNSPQKMFMSCSYLRHDAYLNSTSNVLAYLLIIFLGRDWFGFFLNKWGCIRFTP